MVRVRWLLGLILPKKKLQYFSEPCHAAPVTIQKFLEMRCCLTKCSEKNLWLFLLWYCLTTVWHSLLLPPTNEFLQLAGQAPGYVALIFLYFHTGFYLWPQLWIFWNMLWAHWKFYKVSIPAVWWKHQLFCNCSSQKYHCRYWMLIHFLWCWRFTDIISRRGWLCVT